MNAVHDATGNVILAAQHGDLRRAIEVLKDEYVFDEQDEATYDHLSGGHLQLPKTLSGGLT